ncbi:MAG TPA: YihY/virulence factor BrkB family protein [Actinomycetota bacterium]
MANLAQRTTGRLRDLSQTAIARAIQLVSEFLGRFTPPVQTRIVRGVQLGVEVHVKSTEDDVTTHGAALTYAGFLSLVPLILLGLAVTGEIAVLTENQDDWFTKLIDAIPGLSALIGGQEQALASNAASLGVIGLVGVLWTASVLSSRAQRALAVIFGLPPRAMVNRMRALGVTIGLGLALFVSLAATGLVRKLNLDGLLNVPLQIATWIGLFGVEIGYFTLAYWLLTPRRELRFRDHLAGGVVMAVGWGVLKYVGGFFIDRTISKASALYGTLGTVFGLLLFIRIAMWLFLYGAEVNSLVRSIRRDEPDGLLNSSSTR